MTNQQNKSETFNVSAFGSDVLIYSFGQAILLFFGFFQNLVIPKSLSTVEYGYWQLFYLCTTYVGFLHFGFITGLLIRWAGKNLTDLSEEIPTAFRITVLEQVLVVILLIPIAATTNFLPKEIAFAVLANTILVNLLTFFVTIAQSVKQFTIITKANIVNCFMFFLAILLIFLLKLNGYILLVLATILVNLIIVSIYTLHFRNFLFQQSTHRRPLLEYTKENIGIGIFVLLGNFIALSFATIDRLTVSSFFPITQFAVYAFAMSMCSFVTVFLQAVAQVFFPYLSGSDIGTRKKAYGLLKPALVIFWALSLAAYFPFSVGIRYYLPHYSESLPLMAILLCTVGFSGQINILHANFFKVYRKQRTYFVLAGVAIIGAGSLNFLSVLIFDTLKSVATTAVVSFGIWYIFNELALRSLVAVTYREIVKWELVIGTYIGAFLGTYLLAKTWTTGFCTYGLLFIGITAVFLHKETEQLWSIIIGSIKHKKVSYNSIYLEKKI